MQNLEEGEEWRPEKEEVQMMDGLPGTSAPVRSWTTVNSDWSAKALSCFSSPSDPMLVS